MWLLTATLWLTKLLSKHVDYCRSAGLCMLACVIPVYNKWLAASSLITIACSQNIKGLGNLKQKLGELPTEQNKYGTSNFSRTGTTE